jgi:hypothetical protein
MKIQIEFPADADGNRRIYHPSGAIETRSSNQKSTFQIPPGPIIVRYRRKYTYDGYRQLVCDSKFSVYD